MRTLCGNFGKSINILVSCRGKLLQQQMIVSESHWFRLINFKECSMFKRPCLGHWIAWSCLDLEQSSRIHISYYFMSKLNIFNILQFCRITEAQIKIRFLASWYVFEPEQKMVNRNATTISKTDIMKVAG